MQFTQQGRDGERQQNGGMRGRGNKAIYTAWGGMGNGSRVCGERGSSVIYMAGDGAGTAAEYAGDGGAALYMQQGAGT